MGAPPRRWPREPPRCRRGAARGDGLRIWTSYDETQKKHWLTVNVGKESSVGPLPTGVQLRQNRFLLQDNTMTAWHTHRKSLPERVHGAVESMIEAIDRMHLAPYLDDGKGGDSGVRGPKKQ